MLNARAALHKALLKELGGSSSSVRRMVQRTVRARLLPATLARADGLRDDATLGEALVVLGSSGDGAYRARLLKRVESASARGAVASAGANAGAGAGQAAPRVPGFEESGDCLPLQVCSDDVYVYVTST